MVATDRPRAPAAWRLATVLVVALAVISAFAWKKMRALGLGRPFKVLKITAQPGAEQRPSEVSGAGGDLAARQSLSNLARVGAGAAAAVPVRRVDGAAFIAGVEKAGPLSAAQRARLTTTFEMAAKLQATIDGTDNPETRAALQLRLDDQVRTRLRMILPPESLPLMSQVDEAGGPVAFQFHQSP